MESVYTKAQVPRGPALGIHVWPDTFRPQGLGYPDIIAFLLLAFILIIKTYSCLLYILKLGDKKGENKKVTTLHFINLSYIFFTDI